MRVTASCAAERRFSVITAAALLLREPARLELGEQRVSLFPSVVVLHQAGFGMLCRVAGVEVVGNGVREIAFLYLV